MERPRVAKDTRTCKERDRLQRGSNGEIKRNGDVDEEIRVEVERDRDRDGSEVDLRGGYHLPSIYYSRSIYLFDV